MLHESAIAWDEQADRQAGCEDLLVGHCENLQYVKELIRRVAPADMTVLITGETGTGKELAARAIHGLSSRRNQPFISVNCAAIPDSLLESELFGFEKGAFTGAAARQEGRLKAADRGTIFLDEIGDMSLATQAKILRALESREIQPLGASKTTSVDFRVVAATHQSLELLINEQRFRTDLYFRLNVLPLYLPPLRERRDDIPELVARFVRQLNDRYRRRVVGVTEGGLDLLVEQDWPGNVRQLRNVIEGAFLICSTQFITTGDLRLFHRSLTMEPRIGAAIVQEQPRLPVTPEPERLSQALQATGWNKSKAAEVLRCSRMTIYRKIAKYHLRPEGTVDESGSKNFSATA
jgi:transcriptional regulator with PAS, ATPase and Fis domain